MISPKEHQQLTLCFLSHSSGIAGAEKAFPKLLEGLKEHGVEVFVLLPENGPIEEILKHKNISYSIIRYSRWINSDTRLSGRIKRTIRNLIMVVPIMIKIRKWQCNIVYSNTSTICSGALAAKFLHLPHIWHFREFGTEDYGYSYDLGKTFSQWLTNKLSTVCPTNSKAVLKKYEKFIDSDKLKVLYESYKDTDQNDNTAEDILIDKSPLNCIMIGSLHEAKGHKDAIFAVNTLLKLGLDVRLFIVGTGDEIYKKVLTDLISNLRIENKIEFMGHLENPKSLMNQCDILLMCSKNEAFGLVTLEALQAGVPVIGTRSGGTLELVKEDINGLLYSPGNYTELADKIEYLYRHPGKIKEFGSNGKAWATKTFLPDNYVLETFSLLKQVL